MPRDPLGEYVRRIEREQDGAPMFYPDALIRLIDAVRDYLRADKALGDELLREGAITLDQYNEGLATNEPLKRWLKEHEEHGVDPSLNGIIKEQRR
jgi:hypothetical protein